MNLNHEETDSDFNQRCLELAKLLRTEQTDAFLRLYDSLPSEWNGSRVSNSPGLLFHFFLDSISKYLMTHIYSLIQQKNIFVNCKNSTNPNSNFSISECFIIIKINKKIPTTRCQNCQYNHP